MNPFIGLPVYGKNYDTLILNRSLTNPDDIPNPDGAVVGSLVVFDSVKGVKSNPSIDQADWVSEWGNHRIYYDGPFSAKPLTAWSSKDADLAASLGVTFAFEIHRDCFDGVDQSTWLTAGAVLISPLELRGSANFGYLYVAAGATTSDATWDLVMGSEATGVADTGSYMSKYANDKDFVPVVMSHRRGFWDLYIDGYYAGHRAVTTAAPTEFDDLYIAGKQYNQSGNTAPAGFPYYMRNFQIIGSPVVLPIHPDYGRPVILGDSVVAQGDYYVNSPRYNATHDGAQTDAGCTPMLERLMHRAGVYTSDVHNSGRTGARMLYVATATGLIEQVDGTNAGTDFDANEQNSKLGVIFCGLNDIISETSTIADIKIAARAVLVEMLDRQFKDIVLCTIYNARGATSVGNSPAVIDARTTALNAAYVELANEFERVHLCDVNAAFGTQDSKHFRSDLYHLIEEGQALLGRTIYNTLESNVF